jgi:hypothetical protein
VLVGGVRPEDGIHGGLVLEVPRYPGRARLVILAGAI